MALPLSHPPEPGKAQPGANTGKGKRLQGVGWRERWGMNPWQDPAQGFLAGHILPLEHGMCRVQSSAKGESQAVGGGEKEEGAWRVPGAGGTEPTPGV